MAGLARAAGTYRDVCVSGGYCFADTLTLFQLRDGGGGHSEQFLCFALLSKFVKNVFFYYF